MSALEGGTWYYAVGVGRDAGIFTNWEDVEQRMQGQGYSFDDFTRFATFEEALSFFHERNIDMGDPVVNADGSCSWSVANRDIKSNGDPNPNDPRTMVAFCGGSALGNGLVSCNAAYACVFPNYPNWVVKGIMDDGHKPTNNRAKFMAALAALKHANDQPSREDEPLYIYSDNRILIDIMNEWVFQWQRNGWRKTNGKPVKNRDLVESLLRAQGNRRVLWRHVKAHTGGQDWASKRNDIANTEAHSAAKDCARNF